MNDHGYLNDLWVVFLKNPPKNFRIDQQKILNLLVFSRLEHWDKYKIMLNQKPLNHHKEDESNDK
jgi:hypothetical protein